MTPLKTSSLPGAGSRPAALFWIGRMAAVAASAALLALSGCVGYSPNGLTPGVGETAVRAQMGEPTDRHALPEGRTRLEFARGPAGRHTYMLDFDAAGRLQAWSQVLTEANFARVQPGWTAEQLRSELGRPTQEQVFPLGQVRVWSYRFDSWDCSWFQVTVALRDARVTETGLGPDPRCNARDDAWN
jgi:hypothetical protein